MKKFEGEYDQVSCEVDSTPYGNTRAENAPPGEIDCKFSDDGSDDSLYGGGGSARDLSGIEVDGNVEFSKDIDDGDITVRGRGEKLKVYNDPVGKLVVTTESAEQMEGREAGESPLPDRRALTGETVNQGDVITHLGCLSDGNERGELAGDCAVVTRDGEFKSVSNVRSVEVKGDVDIADDVRNRSLDVRPRTSVVQTSVGVDEETGGVDLDLIDRRERMQNR